MLRKSVLLTLVVLITVLTMVFSTVNVFAEGYLRIEFEDYDDWNPDLNPHDSGQFLKAETTDDVIVDGENIGTIGNVGGTFEEAWILYENIDFGANGAKKVSIQYCNNSTRCTPDARIELRLGDLDGEVIAEVELPPTGSDWKHYETATADMKRIITGKHDIYVVMLGETDPTYKYIGNFDYMEFTEAEPGEAPTPSPGEETTPTPTEEKETPTPTKEATPSPSPSAETTPSPSPTPEEGDGPSPIIYIVIAVVVAAAAVVVFYLIKSKKK